MSADRSPEDGWLKIDPSNGMLVAPSGCHYETERDALWIEVIEGCGCGSPEEAFDLAHDIVACFKRGPGDVWRDAEADVRRLVEANPSLAAHLILHLLDHTDLMEHGSSIGGSWLTGMGERFIAQPRYRDGGDQ